MKPLKRRPIVEEPESTHTPGNDVELASMEARLRIDKHQLDDELIEQPMVFHEVAERLADAKSRRDLVKDQYKTLEAELDLSIRADYEISGAKCTEKMIDAMVQVSKKRRAKFKEVVDAEREVALWEGMRDSFRDRSFLLRELVQLHIASYYQTNSVTGTDNMRRDHMADKNMQEMARKRAARP